jgi:hypothetical protein
MDRRDFLKLGLASLATAAVAPQSFAKRRASVGINSDMNLGRLGGNVIESPHFAGPLPYRVMSDAGLGWVRYTLYWNTIMPASNTYLWDQADAEIGGAVDAGLKVFLEMVSAPAWATGGVPINEPWTCTNAKTPALVAACKNPPPLDSGAQVAMVERVVERYKDRINAIGFCNEPHYHDFFQWGEWDGNHFTPDFNKLIDWILRPSYDAVKRIAPDLPVVGSEMDDIGSHARILALERDAGQLFDILSFHGYDWEMGYPRAALERVDGFLEAQAGDPRPTWLTETGVRSNPRIPGSMRAQAEGILGFLDGVEERGISHVFFYRIKGHETNDNGWTYVDLPRPDNVGKMPYLIKPVTFAMRERLTGTPFPGHGLVDEPGEGVRRRPVRRNWFDPMDTAYDPARGLYVRYDEVKKEYVPAHT